jgi:glycosyltransferase involved in cell wall biosynthesis
MVAQTSPLVSVLVTAHNREQYVGEAIASVLAQTLTDFEVIVVDDASTDRTAAIAEDYARRDSRVRVVVNDRNLGDYANRNKAAGLARGSFLKYHDSDDVMYRHCLAAMAEPLAAEPRAGFALSGSRYWPGGACPMLLTPALSFEREYLGTGLFHLGPSSAMFRAGVFRELGGFPESGVASDYLFWLHACARVNVLLVPGDLFYYRVHAGQEYGRDDAEAQYATAAAQAWAVLKSGDCPLHGPSLRQARRNFLFATARGAFRHVRRGRIRAARMLLALSGPSPTDWVRYLGVPRRRAVAGTPSPAHVETVRQIP